MNLLWSDEISESCEWNWWEFDGKNLMKNFHWTNFNWKLLFQFVFISKYEQLKFSLWQFYLIFNLVLIPRLRATIFTEEMFQKKGTHQQQEGFHLRPWEVRIRRQKLHHSQHPVGRCIPHQAWLLTLLLPEMQSTRPQQDRHPRLAQRTHHLKGILLR